MIPFNIHDAVMEAEDQAAKAKRDEYEKGKTTKVQVETEMPPSANATVSTRSTSSSSTSMPSSSSSSFTTTSGGSLADRIAARRAAARQAAEELAKSRREKGE